MRANGLISFAAGPRFFGANPASAPRSCERRQSTRLDEYSPSRRSKAPTSPCFVQAAASAKTFRLYSAVNRRRRGFAGTSVSCATNPISSLLTVRSKLAPKEELIEAVERALTRDSRQRAERTRMRELLARFEELTPREREVLSHVVRGRLNKQIAADLGIHERTVKLHRATLTTKLHVSSVAELARLVQEAGLFDIPSGSFTKGQ